MRTDSQYPFDELSLTAVSRVTLDKSALGFNAGAGVTYYVTEAVGVSFLTRFSQADIEAMREGGEPVVFNAGGFRVGGIWLVPITGSLRSTGKSAIVWTRAPTTRTRTIRVTLSRAPSAEERA